MALVQSLGAAAPQDVQPERATAAAAVELPLQDARPDSLPLAVGLEVEMLDPQRTRVLAYRDGARPPAADQHDLCHGRVKCGQEALADPDRVEPAQALKVGTQDDRPQFSDPLRVSLGRRAQ